MCTLYKDDEVVSVIRFENGVEKEKKFEFDNGKMIEFDKEGVVVYRGSYKGDAIEGFSRYGKGLCYEYLNGRLNRIDFVKNGLKKGYQLIGDVLKEYDANGKLLYEGGFEGSAEDGFDWSGKGREYLKDGIIAHGVFKNGKRVKTIQEICGEKMTEYDDDNRIVYIGKYSQADLKRHGKGECFVYEGDNLKEVYHCENGTITWKTIEFKDDSMIEYDENGELIYEGEFMGDVKSGFVREGEGQEFADDAILYVGEWRNGKRDGMGRSYKDSLVYYKGGWKKGVPNGKGELMNGYEVKYKGVWKNGLLEVEKGMWFDYVSEKMCGLYENGVKKYEGEMKNGVPNGRGVYYDRNGSVKYDGEWKNGLLEVEKGMWFDYVSEEMCVLYENGVKKYEGEMKNGIPNGRGIYFDKSGRIKHKGSWKNGLIEVGTGVGFNFLSETLCGLYENGMKKYEGEMKNGIPNGRGIYYDRNGNKKYEGEWKNGLIEVEKGMWFDYVSEKTKSLHLIVHNSTDWRQLHKMVSELEIAENACNDMRDDLVISGFGNLRSIVVKKNAMMNLNSLKICDCDMLEKIVVEGGDWDYENDKFRAPFLNVKSVIITSEIYSDFLISRSSSIHNIHNRRLFIQKNKIIDFIEYLI